MKSTIKYLLVALLLMAVSQGTWAQEEQSESFTTNQNQDTYTGEHFKITCTDAGDDDGFELSDGETATVDANGKVTAVGAGTATITATATNSSEDTSDDLTATCEVKVLNIAEGKYIRLGVYEGEYVDWFVARNNANGMMMLSKYVLTNMKFGSNATYPQSNIYKWLDADGGGTFENDLRLTSAERSLVKTVNLSSTSGDGTDRFIIPHRTNEQPNGSPYTKAYYIYDKSSLCGAYWLREARDATNPRVIRSSDETVAARYSGPGNSNGVRPMFYLNTDALSSLDFTGSGTEDDPYVFEPRYDLALDVTPSKGATVAVTLTKGGNTIFSGNLPNKLLASEAAGATVTLTATPNSGYTFKNVTVTSGGAAVPTTGEGNTRTFTMPAADVTVKVDLSLPTDESGAYLIRSLTDWELFCEDINSGNTYSGETVKMTANVNGITTRSSKDKAFSGIFDGQGHTLNLNINITTAEETSAPFGWLNNATVKNLHITGSETTAGKRYASIAGYAQNSTITNCWSEVALTSSLNGWINGGAFVGRVESKSTLTLEGCVFTGSITHSSAGGNDGGGMVGWTNGTTIVNNCLFAPSAYSTQNYTSLYMFVGGNARGNITLTNCYYNAVAAATSVAKEGKKALTYASDPGDLGELVGDYDVLKAYAHGILFNSKYYVEVNDITLTAATVFDEPKYVTSFYSGTKDYQMLENAKAYTMSLDGGKVLFRQIGDDGQVIPHGTAVVIVASEPDVTLRILNSTTVAAHEGNILQGADTAVAVTDGKVDGKTPYVLNISGDVLGFYKFTGSTIPAGKAYYVVSE